MRRCLHGEFLNILASLPGVFDPGVVELVRTLGSTLLVIPGVDTPGLTPVQQLEEVVF